MFKPIDGVSLECQNMKKKKKYGNSTKTNNKIKTVLAFVIASPIKSSIKINMYFIINVNINVNAMQHSKYICNTIEKEMYILDCAHQPNSVLRL